MLPEASAPLQEESINTLGKLKVNVVIVGNSIEPHPHCVEIGRHVVVVQSRQTIAVLTARKGIVVGIRRSGIGNLLAVLIIYLELRQRKYHIITVGSLVCNSLHHGNPDLVCCAPGRQQRRQIVIELLAYTGLNGSGETM